ncbi:MAG: hypothetical protein GY696_08230 [Gammaproteobacteria bacterium]|nr:hypothetical protein [Gammaproteobacteria bacterium]
MKAHIQLSRCIAKSGKGSDCLGTAQKRKNAKIYCQEREVKRLSQTDAKEKE